MGGLTVLARSSYVAYTIVASRLDRWWISGPMVFVAAGAKPWARRAELCSRCR
jgi:hypothetical protein